MADPATITAVAKAAAAVLSDERTRKTIGWIIAAILSPLILIIVLFCALLSGTADHNNTAVELCFHGGVIPGSMPADYREYIGDMRQSFTLIDVAIATINADMEDSSSLDSVRVKAIFYSLFFGAESPSRMEHRQYVNCFVTYEERTRTVENDDGTTSEETYTVAVPIRELAVVYANITSAIGVSATHESQVNATEIYYRVLYGRPAPTYGDAFDQWSDGLPLSSAPFIGADGFCSPLGEDWRSMVTSEFGYRKDPFTGQTKGHGGIDLGAPKGTSIRAALPGTVYVVRYANSGYGYHVMIDHGGGFVTLYAHCSKIFATEGQQVEAGTLIAEVGSTGRSTGNHLHFEVRIDGEKQNPRSYLP
jgi:murein DD-endopeptidase MepM/ murein hydrolase activator NlpD